MKKDAFYRLGEMIYRFRWLIILAWLGLLLACVPFLPRLMDPFKAIGFTDPHSQSAQANDILNKKLGFSYNRFIIVYHSDKLLATNPKFMREIHSSLEDLKHFSIKNQIIYPTVENKQISKNKHTAYAIVLLKATRRLNKRHLMNLSTLLKLPPS